MFGQQQPIGPEYVVGQQVAVSTSARSAASGWRLLHVSSSCEGRPPSGSKNKQEAAYEMDKQGNALEWYDDTISKTLELLSEKHPEIKKDPNAKTPFLASLAITSQNMSVPENLRYAEQVYNEYKLTGRFPEVGFGEKGGSMKANFIKANKLLDRLGSVQEVEKFLQTKFRLL